jgi:hypothetical protein
MVETSNLLRLSAGPCSVCAATRSTWRTETTQVVSGVVGAWTTLRPR